MKIRTKNLNSNLVITRNIEGSISVSHSSSPVHSGPSGSCTSPGILS